MNVNIMIPSSSFLPTRAIAEVCVAKTCWISSLLVMHVSSNPTYGVSPRFEFIILWRLVVPVSWYHTPRSGVLSVIVADVVGQLRTELSWISAIDDWPNCVLVPAQPLVDCFLLWESVSGSGWAGVAPQARRGGHHQHHQQPNHEHLRPIRILRRCEVPSLSKPWAEEEGCGGEHWNLIQRQSRLRNGSFALQQVSGLHSGGNSWKD